VRFKVDSWTFWDVTVVSRSMMRLNTSTPPREIQPWMSCWDHGCLKNSLNIMCTL